MEQLYSIIVVDDEPASLMHIKTIIEKKCPDYQVSGTAVNGEEALAEVEKCRPDVVISDVKMPVMDGIELAEKVKERHPDILFIIISGYQDFEYAKSALKSGVCDYLLKPLKPSDFQQTMEKLKTRLNSYYYEKRRQLIKAMCHNAESPAEDSVTRYFPEGKYYSGIIRKNGLPRRFSGNCGFEIFSMEEEQIYLYGRDEMEALYLVSEALLYHESFAEIMERYYQREQEEYSYVTGVVYEEQFYLEEFPQVVKRIYRKLDETIVVGQNQIIFRESGIGEKESCKKTEKEILERIEYLTKYKESNQILQEVERALELWKRNRCSQIYVEGQIYYILQLIRNVYGTNEERGGIEYEIDDAFFYSSSMDELKESILNLLNRMLPVAARESTDDKMQMFHSILAYLNHHMEENITLTGICRRFGVSQTTLSKLFRMYQECSFGKYLTTIRIEKAKKIMEQEPEIYIKDVAGRVGYNDQFYFSRIFHSVEGMRPSDYLAGKCKRVGSC